MQNTLQSKTRQAGAVLIAALLAVMLAAPAFGSGCPGKMAEIDQRLAAGPDLDAQALEEVVSLRAEGDEMHRKGQHGAAMAAFEEALAILDEVAHTEHHGHH